MRVQNLTQRQRPQRHRRRTFGAHNVLSSIAQNVHRRLARAVEYGERLLRYGWRHAYFRLLRRPAQRSASGRCPLLDVYETPIHQTSE